MVHIRSDEDTSKKIPRAQKIFRAFQGRSKESFEARLRSEDGLDKIHRRNGKGKTAEKRRTPILYALGN